MDYSRIGELVSEHRTPDALRSKLASLESQDHSRGIARAIRMTKAAVNRATTLECLGSKQHSSVERFLGHQHFGIEFVRERGGLGEGKVYYAILTVKEGGKDKFLVLATSPKKHPDYGYPGNVTFNSREEAYTEAQRKANILGRENALAQRY
jgi:hypothetical protein